MSAPPLQRAARSFSSLPVQTLSHSSRDIKYAFLDGCRNITPSCTLDSADTHKDYKGSVSCHPNVQHSPSTAADCCPPLPKYPPTLFDIPTHLQKQDMGSGHFPASKKRLPVFLQMCKEAMPGVALGDVHLQNSSQELEELPDAKEPREDMMGWIMKQGAARSPHNKA